MAILLLSKLKTLVSKPFWPASSPQGLHLIAGFTGLAAREPEGGSLVREVSSARGAVSVTTPTMVPPSTDGQTVAPIPKRWPLWRALALQLGVVVLVTAALFGAKAVAGSLNGLAAQSIGIAAVLVGVAGAIALVIASLAGNPKQAASMVLAGMLVRLFVPLAVLLLVSRQWPELEEAGFREQVLILYLVALVVETYAAIRVTGMPAPRFASK